MTDKPDRPDGDGLQIELLPRSVSQDNRRVSVHFDFGDSAAAAAFRIKVAFRIEGGDFAVRFDLATPPTFGSNEPECGWANRVAVLEAALQEEMKSCLHWKKLAKGRDGAEGAGDVRDLLKRIRDFPHNSTSSEQAMSQLAGTAIALLDAPKWRPKPAPDAMREALETIKRTTFSGSEMGEEYMRGNRDAHATCAAMAKCALSAPVPSPDGASEALLPCDVHLPPATYIRKGCTVATLMAGLRHREKFPDDMRVFSLPSPAVAAEPVAWQALPYATPQELVTAFKSGVKFVLHYHDKTFDVTSMEARERVVYVWPPGLPVKVRPDGSSAEGDSGRIWLASPPVRGDREADRYFDMAGEFGNRIQRAVDVININIGSINRSVAAELKRVLDPENALSSQAPHSSSETES